MKTRPIVTLLTDFGQADGYVASMKGVILSICPLAGIVDITHLISPRDIRSAAFILKSSSPYFPEGTIHVCVVDPGVGTARRAIAVKTGRTVLIGPDNGIFTWELQAYGAAEVRSIENADYFRAQVSSTFHGRDVFAPVAAHLAAGASFDSIGPVCTPITASWATARFVKGSLHGEVIHIDHFGNAITNITDENLLQFASPADCRVEVGGKGDIPIVKTYGSTEPGAILALIGSSGHLEVAAANGNAARELGIGTGAPVTVSR